MKLPPNLGEVLARVQGERRNTLQHSISVLPRTWLTSWQGSIRKTAAASSTSVFSKRWAGVKLLPFFVSAPLEVILFEFCVCAALSANWCSSSTLKRRADTSQLFALLLKLVYLDCFLASQLFPACNDDIAIMWVELHQERIAV